MRTNETKRKNNTVFPSSIFHFVSGFNDSPKWNDTELWTDVRLRERTRHRTAP